MLQMETGRFTALRVLSCMGMEELGSFPGIEMMVGKSMCLKVKCQKNFHYL